MLALLPVAGEQGDSVRRFGRQPRSACAIRGNVLTPAALLLLAC